MNLRKPLKKFLTLDTRDAQFDYEKRLPIPVELL